MSITVHHLNFSRSLRALWMLEELGLEYEIRQWERDKNFRAPDAAREIHPLGRFPMVEVDGHVLAESGAVLEYFANREGKLRPTDPASRLQYDFFLHYAEGSAMPPLLVQLILENIKGAPMPFFAKPIAKAIVAKVEAAYSRPAIVLHMGFMEQALAGQPYFAGTEFSLADIQMFYAVEAGLSRGRGSYPQLQAWRSRVTARDAYKRAEQKGGPAIPPAARQG